jgi:hypothetical protein
MQRIDGLVATRKFLPEQAFKELFNPKSYAKRYPSLDPTALGAKRHNKFTEHIGTILSLGEFASQTAAPEQYIEAREVQAYEAVEALGCVASDELRTNSVFVGHYLPAVTHLATVTILRDSIRSSIDNYQRGKLGFSPEPRHHYEMIYAISRHNDGISGVLLRASSPAAIASQGLIEATGIERSPDLRLLEA